jgi:hypothetical protein
MLKPTHNGERYQLDNPLDLPRAAGFLWNRKMMIQVTCRGYAVAQFMQPEPAKYAYAPNLEARTFMQPEQPYYAHHRGRFFYIKDEESGALFSAPYEPVRAQPDRFMFSASPRLRVSASSQSFPALARASLAFWRASSFLVSLEVGSSAAFFQAARAASFWPRAARAWPRR